jgi:hypothetical protein
MAALVVNNGEAVALSYLTGKTTTTEALKLRLYVNNVTPSEADVVGTYTSAAGGGYADISIPRGDWTVTPGAPTSASITARVWTFSGALTGNATIYGYILIRDTTGDLVVAENFSTPFTPASNGDSLTLNLALTAD